MTDTRMPKPPLTLTASKFSNLSDVFVLGEGGEYTQNVDQLSHDEWAKTFYICGVSTLVRLPLQHAQSRRIARARGPQHLQRAPSLPADRR